MSRFGELLRAANNFKLLAAIGRSGGELSSVADLLDNMIDSPQMLDSVRRFRAVPGGAAMLEGRYPPLQPDIDRFWSDVQAHSFLHERSWNQVPFRLIPRWLRKFVREMLLASEARRALRRDPGQKSDGQKPCHYNTRICLQYELSFLPSFRQSLFEPNHRWMAWYFE